MTQVTDESDELDLLMELRRKLAQDLRDFLMAMPDEPWTRGEVQDMASKFVHTYMFGSGSGSDFDVKTTAGKDDKMQVCVTIYPPQQISIYMKITPGGSYPSPRSRARW